MITFDPRVICALPCGDVVDLETIEIVEGMMRCMWCDATYDVEQFIVWRAGRDRVLINIQRTIVRLGERALEIVGRASCCGAALVRNCGSKDKPEHCDVTRVQILKN